MDDGHTGRELASAFPSLTSAAVPLCLAILVFITVLNLFGLAESARAFLVPTLVFIAGLYAVVFAGLIHPFGQVTRNPRGLSTATSTVGVVLILKAFASGCSALTGVEAIANGTPSFKEPRIKRGQRTELLLGVILGSLLLGLPELVVKFHLRPQDNVTLLSQITERSVGHGVLFYVIELSTTVALALAANTSFGGLPVLFSLLARDSFLPRIFTLHGERTVYRYGVVVLAVLAAVLIIGSGGNTQRLIPLYAIGVFIGFTLAQTGLVRHWFSHHGRWWAGRAALNGLGAVLSGAAAVIAAEAEKGKIGTLAGLPGLSLDALTSVAYGPEAIVIVLAAGRPGCGQAGPADHRRHRGAAGHSGVLLPPGHRRLPRRRWGLRGEQGEPWHQLASLLAGASLIVDYILTVAVSVTAGVAALTSAFPSLTPAAVPLVPGRTGRHHRAQPLRAFRERTRLLPSRPWCSSAASTSWSSPASSTPSASSPAVPGG